MKLKTYLRGLGIGIIVTTIIMAVTLGGKETKMSDDEIIARAKELGMVERAEADSDHENAANDSENAAELKSEDEQEPESAAQEVSTEQIETEESDLESPKETEDNDSETPKETEEGESAGGEETESQSEPAVEAEIPEEGGEVTAGEVVSVSIASGDDSVTVSRNLEELNLVISATQFDRFLCENGYAKRISPGDYEIAIGSSEETIAKIITKSK